MLPIVFPPLDDRFILRLIHLQVAGLPAVFGVNGAGGKNYIIPPWFGLIWGTQVVDFSKAGGW